MNLSFMKQMISLLRVNVNLSLIVDLVRCQTSTNLRNYISKKTQDSRLQQHTEIYRCGRPYIFITVLILFKTCAY